MKKIMSLALSALLLCMFVVPTASAEDSISKEESPLIEARYSDFSMVYATLHKMDNGFYEISGGAGTFSSQKRHVALTASIVQLTAILGPMQTILR